MDQKELQEVLTDLLPGAEFKTNPQFVEAIVPVADLHKFANELKTNPKTQFNMLVCCTGADIDNNFLVVYHLRSTTLKHECVIKSVISDRENPAIDTVSDIWIAAEYFEREIFDFYGIKFNNHPDLRRLFLEDDFVGFPLRKDYVDNINIVQ
ncbi:MAG: NADH-quinone oxidoreductase subunit C [Bacteroidales bacterium]